MIKYPEAFFEVRVQILPPPHPVTGLCAGYEGGGWRAQQLAGHLFQWLPFAALNQESQFDFAAHNFVEHLRTAAAHIYSTERTQSRGELGELLLHLACILHFGTAPVLCKLLLKSSSNETVKGFDGIHVVAGQQGVELWLGESKFYEDPKAAIRDAVSSIRDHILPDFLSTEKAMVIGHIGPDVPERAALVHFFKSKTSGDELLAIATFPILIAYESATVKDFSVLCEEYKAALLQELTVLRDYFQERAKDLHYRFHLIFVPMEKKKNVVEAFDKKLTAFL